MTSSIPFSGNPSAGTYRLASRPLAPTEKPPHAQIELVGGDSFASLQIPVLEGRVFDDGDGPDRPRVVVVDQFLARRQFPGRGPIGELVTFGSARNYEIVGVVGTINAMDLAKPIPEERIYLSALQRCCSLSRGVRVTSPARAATQIDPMEQLRRA